jgi:hypothetical protein
MLKVQSLYILYKLNIQWMPLFLVTNEFAVLLVLVLVLPLSFNLVTMKEDCN